MRRLTLTATVALSLTLLAACGVFDRSAQPISVSLDAERLYVRSGWQRVGTIPDYAMWPGGGFCDSTFFWKKL